ncbi:unnamed protein product [Schistosoma curassoni]|uniref:Uncharacterized protein n=1 Tax=Schistosoma curassoni TaxID=6186 RepID=A0A183K459_9TREM|nr:unnamed protein product [Schistosoma curassoni]
MYMHLRVDVHPGARTQYRPLQAWLAVGYRTRVSSCSGLISWIYLHPRVHVHFKARTQYLLLQIPSRYPRY